VVTKFLKKTMTLETFISNIDHAVNFINKYVSNLFLQSSLSLQERHDTQTACPKTRMDKDFCLEIRNTRTDLYPI
jgi:hypothetical protein